jgi:phosphatidylserine/phosphatidylglycerophosphate/cardiolipin synthase-like enzyme
MATDFIAEWRAKDQARIAARPPDLNRLALRVDHIDDCQPLEDHSTKAWGDGLAVHFRDLERRLIEEIARAQVVVGCVAWLTSEPILEALSRVPLGVSVIVQKEDFLRPDYASSRRWTMRLRELYESLPEPPIRYEFPGVCSNLSVCGDPSIQSVRCLGNHNADRSPAFPRMHNKFLVFCGYRSGRQLRNGSEEHGIVTPERVWTGSFNFTRNAGLSLENAVVIHHQSVATAYCLEWSQLLGLSEALDWQYQWCEPEWRIGS